MPEWSKGHAWKACIWVNCIEGSNPSLSVVARYLVEVWRVAGAVERGGLENRCALQEHRGFESLTLRCHAVRYLVEVLPERLNGVVAQNRYACKEHRGFESLTLHCRVVCCLVEVLPERLNGAVAQTVVLSKSIEGSNPSLSVVMLCAI